MSMGKSDSESDGESEYILPDAQKERTSAVRQSSLEPPEKSKTKVKVIKLANNLLYFITHYFIR